MKYKPFCIIWLFALFVSCSNVQPTTVKKGKKNCFSKMAHAIEGQQYIVGGKDVTTLSDVRAKSLVRIRKKKGDDQTLCTGFLAGERLVITATHCFNDYPELIVDFGLNVNKMTPVKVKTFKTHPNFNKKLINYDIAYIILAEDPPKEFQPIPIWMDMTKIKKGQLVSLYGYGLVSATDKTKFPTVLQTVDSIFKAYVTEKSKPPGNGLVLVGPNPGKSTCGGDSGGPAFIKDENGNWFAIANTTATYSIYFPEIPQAQFLKDPCKTGATIHTSVSYFRSWIEQSSGIKLLTEPIIAPPPEPKPDPKPTPLPEKNGNEATQTPSKTPPTKAPMPAEDEDC